MIVKSAFLFGFASIALVAMSLSGNAWAEEESSKPAPGVGWMQSQEAPIINLKSTTTHSALNPDPTISTTSTATINKDTISTSASSAMSAGESDVTITPGTPAASTSGLILTFDSIYYGASVTNPGGQNQPSDIGSDGGVADRTFIRNIPAIGYYLNPNLILGAVTRIDVFPSHNVDYSSEDSFVRLKIPKLIDRGAFTMVADFRLYLPTSTWQQQGGEIVAPELRLVPSYAIPNSRLTIGAITYYQQTIRNDRVDGVDTYAKNYWTNEIYAGPNINYKVSPTLALTALYEFDTVRVTGDNSLAFMTDTRSGNGYTDFEPGVSWDVTPSINVSPFLNMYPGSDFGFDTTSINLWVSIKLL